MTTPGVCEQCRCRAHSAPALEGISLCPLHQAAPDLLEALRAIIARGEKSTAPTTGMMDMLGIARAAYYVGTGGPLPLSPENSRPQPSAQDDPARLNR